MKKEPANKFHLIYADAEPFRVNDFLIPFQALTCKLGFPKAYQLRFPDPSSLSGQLVKFLTKEEVEVVDDVSKADGVIVTVDKDGIEVAMHRKFWSVALTTEYENLPTIYLNG